jgi:hypothetical protein
VPYLGVILLPLHFPDAPRCVSDAGSCAVFARHQHNCVLAVGNQGGVLAEDRRDCCPAVTEPDAPADDRVGYFGRHCRLSENIAP